MHKCIRNIARDIAAHRNVPSRGRNIAGGAGIFPPLRQHSHPPEHSQPWPQYCRRDGNIPAASATLPPTAMLQPWPQYCRHGGNIPAVGCNVAAAWNVPTRRECSRRGRNIAGGRRNIATGGNVAVLLAQYCALAGIFPAVPGTLPWTRRP